MKMIVLRMDLLFVRIKTGCVNVKNLFRMSYFLWLSVLSSSTVHQFSCSPGLGSRSLQIPKLSCFLKRFPFSIGQLLLGQDFC